MLEDHVLSKLSSTPFQLCLGDFMFHIYHIFVEHHVFQSMLRYIFMIYTFHCPLGHFEVSGMNGFFYNLSFIGYLNLNLSVKKRLLSKWFGLWQGCISCGTCSYPKLTEDHVLTSAYVKIFRTVTRNAVNKGVSRKKRLFLTSLKQICN